MVLPGTTHSPYLAATIDAATAAGRALLTHRHAVRAIQYKGRIDMVTDADHLAEAIIRARLTQAFPDIPLLTEESPPPAAAPRRWVVDPLDGTTNYAHGFPCYAVSVALVEGDDGLAGAVYNPVLDELFWATAGGGAFRNGARLAVSTTAALEQSLLATGFPYDIRESPINNVDHFAHFAMEAQAIRRPGSASLDLCYVAAGIFDGFWELKLWPWDVAAGILIIREAAGTVTDFVGAPCRLDAREIVASNGRIHEAMLRVLARGRRYEPETRELRPSSGAPPGATR